MTDQPLFWVAAALCLAVLVVLAIGITGFARGGAFNKNNANKIMRLRLALQFIAVVVIVLFVWIARS